MIYYVVHLELHLPIKTQNVQCSTVFTLRQITSGKKPNLKKKTLLGLIFKAWILHATNYNYVVF